MRARLVSLKSRMMPISNAETGGTYFCLHFYLPAFFNLFWRNRFANLLSPNEKTYKYLFNRHSEGSPIPQIKVFHALDLVYLFGTPIGGRLFPGYFNAEERELSDKMIAYFTNFAKYGKPTNDSIWPVYTRENPVTFVLDIGEPKTIVDYANFTCTFWDSIYPE